MKPELLSEDDIQDIAEDVANKMGTIAGASSARVIEDTALSANSAERGVRAGLAKLGVVRVVDVPSDLHDDFLMWKELRKGPVLVRQKQPTQG